MIPYRPAVYSNQRCGGYRSGDGICRYHSRTSTMAHVRPYIHIQHSRSLARRLLTGKRLRTHAAQSHTEHKHTPHNGCRRVRVHERARTQAHARIDPCESPGCDLATPPSVHERPYRRLIMPPAHHAEVRCGPGSAIIMQVVPTYHLRGRKRLRRLVVLL